MQEKRRHYRKRSDHPVEFQVGDGPRQPGVCRDFSLGGMHIQAESIPAFAASVTVHIRLSGHAAATALPGVVRWVKLGAIGIQFGLLGARETYLITEMLASD